MKRTAQVYFTEQADGTITVTLYCDGKPRHAYHLQDIKSAVMLSRSVIELKLLPQWSSLDGVKA